MASIGLLFLACAFVACHALVPLYNSHVENVIPGEYLVNLKRGSSNLESNTLSHIKILNEFHIGNWRCLHVKVEAEFFGLLAEDENVDFIEANAEGAHIACNDEPVVSGLWGLRRLSARENEAGGNQLWLDEDSGRGVDVYVLDTGIRTTHVDYEGRATWGFTAPGHPGSDGNGHGTHCAGTVGGTVHGVAKNANLIAVQVLGSNGSGTWDQVIAGVEYVAETHVANPGAKSVINMSLGGGATPSLDAAVEEAIGVGVHTAVAAGNSRADACNYSPARVAPAITVGSSDSSDSLSSFSNVGSCVNIIAPGSNVLSTYHLSDTSTNTLSGTSMASPHVAGWVARYLSSHSGDPTPAEVMAAIVRLGTPDRLSGVTDPTPNVLPFRECEVEE